jgi:hypothetical protein
LTSARTLSLLTMLVAVAALAGPHVAGASEPELTQLPTLVQQGSQLVGSNGGWQSNSGTPTKYVFRFTRNGTTVKGPTSMPKSTLASAPLPAGTYPDDPTAHIYDLQAADAGQPMCVEVWGGIHSKYVYADGTVAYDVWEWGHVNIFGQEAKACLTTSGAAPPGPSAPTPPAAPPAPTVPKPQAPLAPTATAAPTVTGVPMVEQTLVGTTGTWSGSAPLTVGLEWLRYDVDGENCQGLGITADTYRVGAVDIGKTIRVRITAANLAGARGALSDPTEVVTALKPTEQNPSIAAAKVTAPHKLVIDQVKAPARFTGRAFRVTLRVTDSRGFLVEGALVTASTLPASALVRPAEFTTAADGLVTLEFKRGAKLKAAIRLVTVVVIARRPGDKLASPRGAIVRLKLPVASAAKR